MDDLKQLKTAAASDSQQTADTKDLKTLASPPFRVGQPLPAIADAKPTVVDAKPTATHGHYSAQGIRPQMEDEFVAVDRIDIAGSKHLKSPISFYGVFDGHGGRAAAKYSRDRLVGNVVDELRTGRTAESALRAAFLKTDVDFLRLTEPKAKPTTATTTAAATAAATAATAATATAATTPTATDDGKTDGKADSAVEPDDDSGCTAVVLLIDAAGKFYCANAGDSRCILVSGSRPKTATALSEDHKPDRPDEEKRIRGVGGFVFNKRLNGELAVSRAIGDRSYKHPVQYHPDFPVLPTGLIADPEIRSGQLAAGDEYFVLACDGLIEAMSNPQIAKWTAVALDVPDAKSIANRADKEHLGDMDVSKMPASVRATIVGIIDGQNAKIDASTTEFRSVSVSASVSPTVVLQTACQTMVDLAINEFRSRDNVSVIIVRPAVDRIVPSSDAAATATKRKHDDVATDATTPVLHASPDDVSSTATTEPLDMPDVAESQAPPKRVKSSSAAEATAEAVAVLPKVAAAAKN